MLVEFLKYKLASSSPLATQDKLSNLLTNSGILLEGENLKELSDEVLDSRIETLNSNLHKSGYKPSKYWRTKINSVVGNE